MTQKRYRRKNLVRLERIKKLRKHHSLQEIGDSFNLTKERIRQILFGQNIQMRRIPINRKIRITSTNCKKINKFYPRQCPVCKKHFIVHSNYKERLKRKNWIYTPSPKKRKFCSLKCYIKSDIFKNLSRNRDRRLQI